MKTRDQIKKGDVLTLKFPYNSDLLDGTKCIVIRTRKAKRFKSGVCVTVQPEGRIRMHQFDLGWFTETSPPKPEKAQEEPIPLPPPARVFKSVDPDWPKYGGTPAGWHTVTQWFDTEAQARDYAGLPMLTPTATPEQLAHLKKDPASGS